MVGYRPQASLIAAITVGVLLCTLSWSGVQAADIWPEILPISEVKEGLHGIGLTVVSGTTIEEFSVEIRGVLEGQGPSKSLILVRVYGPVIERTGGIAAGMSGSPVYVDGKLVGAVAYGFDMADHTLGLLTPAADMILVQQLANKVAADEAESLAAFPAGIPISGQLIRSVVLAANPAIAQKWRQTLPADVAVAVPVATPLMVQGLSQRTMELLEKTFSNSNLLVVPTGGAIGQMGVPLEPGAALGVQLVRGDVNMTAIGTVTFTTADGGFTGFGHPFLNRGTANYFATSATIHETVRSIQMPFKLGSPLDVAGRLLQDRGAGVAGVLGSDPANIALEVNVKDRTNDSRQSFKAQVINDEALSTPLLAIAMLEGLDRGIDRIGRGSALVSLRVELADTTQVITRHNMFYSATDITATALSEVVRGIQALLNNDIGELKLRRVVLEVDIEDDRQTARLESVRARQVAYPGEVLDVEVCVRPFREEPLTMIMKLKIPENAVEGTVGVVARGGGYGIERLLLDDFTEDLIGSQDEDELFETTQAKDLNNLITTLFDRDKNNEVVLELFPYDDEEMPTQTSLKYEQIDKEKEEWDNETDSLQKVKVKLPTSWVIQGMITFEITIVNPKSNE